MNAQFEPSVRLPMPQYPNCPDLGAALSRLFGLSEEVCWLAACHVIGAVSASGCVFRSSIMPGTFQAGGLILVGNPHRTRLLIDWLLAPVAHIQNQRLARLHTLDHEAAANYFREKDSPVLRGNTHALFDMPRSRHEKPKDRTRLSRAIDSAMQPLIVVRNPDHGSVRVGLETTFQRSPLIVEDDFNLAGGAKEDREYLELLARSLGGTTEWEGTGARRREQVPSLCARPAAPALLGCMHPEMLRSAVRNLSPVSERILKKSLTIRTTLASLRQDDVNPEAQKECRAAEAIWWTAIERAVEFRDQSAHFIWELSSEETVSFLHIRRVILGILDSAIEKCPLAYAWESNVAGKVLWALFMIQDAYPCFPTSPINLAVRIFNALLPSHKTTFFRYQEERENEDLQRNKERLLRALDRHGGQGTWPDLRRSLPRQGFKANEPAIKSLMSEGHLAQGPDGVYRLIKGAEDGRPEN